MADEPSYTDLNEMLEAYADFRGIVTLVGSTADLSTLAREIKLQAINALLLARAPDVLNPEKADRFPLFLEALNGASSEVEVITGPDPQPAQRRRLALRAIALGTAADLEEALFPEQQFGDQARAAVLRRRYDEVLALLRLQRDDATGVIPTQVRPRGNFPAPLPYPDPIERPRPWTC